MPHLLLSDCDCLIQAVPSLPSFTPPFRGAALEEAKNHGLGLDRHHAVLVEPHAAEDEAEELAFGGDDRLVTGVVGAARKPTT